MTREFIDAKVHWEKTKDIIAKYEANKIALRKNALSDAYQAVRDAEKIKNQLCPHERCQIHESEQSEQDDYGCWASPTLFRGIRCLDCEQLVLNSSKSGGSWLGGYGTLYYDKVNSQTVAPLIDFADWWIARRYCKISSSAFSRGYKYDLEEVGIKTITTAVKEYEMVERPVTTYAVLRGQGGYTQ